MIRELQITNLGVIAGTRLEFGPGLTVLSGETGAGKTLVTTALSLLLGAKAEPSLVRHGAAEAVVECVIDAPADPAVQGQLAELGAVTDADELIVTRTVAGRSRAIVGGRTVAAPLLAEIVGGAVTLHGQHGQTRLTRSAEQRAIIDAADPAIGPVVEIVRDAWRNRVEALEMLARTRAERDSLDRTLTEYRTLVEDVEAVQPTLGEDAALDATIATLSSLDDVVRVASGAVAALLGSDEVSDADVTALLGTLRRQLEHMPDVPEFAAWHARVVTLLEDAQALGHDIARYLGALDADPAALDAALSRRAQIGTLLRRYGLHLSELLDRYEQAQEALALAADPEARIAELQALVDRCDRDLEAAVERLHDLRARVAADLATRVTAELHALGLAHARFSIAVERNHDPGPTGDDTVTFAFSANPGMPEQPLALVGSGGELSRVMLALETALPAGEGRTFVFDEVDAGIGGAAAIEVGARLAELARRHQVIVVTHLAQVAAHADVHVLVEKVVEADSTTTVTRVLDAEARPGELARMLSGVASSPTAVAHARELIAAARRTEA